MSSLEGPKRDMQLVVIALLIGMTVGITGINIYVSGFESEFVQGTIVPASWTVLLIAIGAAFRQLGLGKAEVTQPTLSGKTTPI